MTPVYLGLGANLGDRLGNLARARELIGTVVRLRECSAVYESEPVGLADQPLFLNQVVAGETGLLPTDLLRALKEIERGMGRQPAIRHGPRPIDVDLLFYGDWVLATDDLIIPHPRLRERSFVLAPLAEIAPGLRHPGTGETVAWIWAAAEPHAARSWIYRLNPRTAKNRPAPLTPRPPL